MSESPASHATAVLEHVVKSVVGDPDAVKVNADADGDKVQLTVEVGPGDMGRVIGRRGRIANAIRTVVRAAGVRDGVDVDVEFLD
ncbi:MAG: KH domain-containing protein [Actinomycetota bacterium]